MKKYFALIIVSFLAFLSCEKDDICIDGTTPKLIIRFYNNDTETDLKSAQLDSVWVEGKSKIEDFTGVSTDSIYIPLDLNADITTFILEKNKVKDTLKFSYTKKDVFVSRSCGYKTVFENFQLDSNTINWIKNINITESTNSTIEDETAAHITIFH